MDDFTQVFEERLNEIKVYLELLDELEKQVQKGAPQFASSGKKITPEQQKILYSSVYLQLYSLVESTISGCINTFSEAIVSRKSYPYDLSINMQREWIKFTAGKYTNIADENGLNNTVELCDLFLKPIADFTIEKGGGGNWDDETIYQFIKRIGLSLKISRDTQKAVKKPFKDGKGAMFLVRDLRNKLAHGNISFVECAEDITVQDLCNLTTYIALYLREVIAGFKLSIELCEFLKIDKRPDGDVI